MGDAMYTYRQYQDSFRDIQLRCMHQNLSWDNAAQQYEVHLSNLPGQRVHRSKATKVPPGSTNEAAPQVPERAGAHQVRQPALEEPDAAGQGRPEVAAPPPGVAIHSSGPDPSPRNVGPQANPERRQVAAASPAPPLPLVLPPKEAAAAKAGGPTGAEAGLLAEMAVVDGGQGVVVTIAAAVGTGAGRWADPAGVVSEQEDPVVTTAEAVRELDPARRVGVLGAVALWPQEVQEQEGAVYKPASVGSPALQLRGDGVPVTTAGSKGSPHKGSLLAKAADMLLSEGSRMPACQTDQTEKAGQMDEPEESDKPEPDLPTAATATVVLTARRSPAAAAKRPSPVVGKPKQQVRALAAPTAAAAMPAREWRQPGTRASPPLKAALALRPVACSPAHASAQQQRLSLHERCPPLPRAARNPLAELEHSSRGGCSPLPLLAQPPRDTPLGVPFQPAFAAPAQAGHTPPTVAAAAALPPALPAAEQAAPPVSLFNAMFGPGPAAVGVAVDPARASPFNPRSPAGPAGRSPAIPAAAGQGASPAAHPFPQHRAVGEVFGGSTLGVAAAGHTGQGPVWQAPAVLQATPPALARRAGMASIPSYPAAPELHPFRVSGAAMAAVTLPHEAVGAEGELWMEPVLPEAMRTAAEQHLGAPAVEGETFDYLEGEGMDESSDEEDERNIPLLSQYAAAPAVLPSQGFHALGSPVPGGGEAIVQAQQLRSPESSTLLASSYDTRLESYLPDELLCEAYSELGLTTLYDWQAQCLCLPGVLEGRNLVYCAPTSGGKSLVAEVLMLRRIVTTQKPAMLVLPYVSLCSEKAAHLSRLLSPLKKQVKEFYGGMHSNAGLGANTGAIVCTIEKANKMVNRLLAEGGEGSLSVLCCLVVDELHMVGEEERGYLQELLLNAVRYCSSGYGEEDPLEGLQIIGMSATLPNVDAVARWLDAAAYHTAYRPVPLRQFIKVPAPHGLEVRDETGHVVRLLAPPSGWPNEDRDHVALLAKETVDAGCSVLIFCCSKKQLVAIPERQLAPRSLELSQVPDRATLCEELQALPGGPYPGLVDGLARGVAFHHADLRPEERHLVERAYHLGLVSVLCATSTLAAGVNLPARRVIFAQPFIGYYAADGSTVLDGTRYRQMAGRAGRAGLDTEGESYLIAGSVPLPKLEALMRDGDTAIETCLAQGKRGMKRAMLEMVATGVVSTAADVQRYACCTLLAAMHDAQAVVAATRAALAWLAQQGFICWSKATQTYDCLPLGKAALASGLSPEDCLLVKADLDRALDGLVLRTELHKMFLCVPVTALGDAHIDWPKFSRVVERLQGPEAAVMCQVGVNPRFVQDQARGVGSGGTGAGNRQQREAERVCKRFWAALVVSDVVREEQAPDVLRRYGMRPGPLDALKRQVAGFASMVATFCEQMPVELGYHDISTMLKSYQARVLRGVREDILPLSEIPHLKGHVARVLYKAGLRDPEAVAAVGSVDEIVAILDQAAPSKGGKKQALGRRRQAVRILRGARELVKSRVRQLRQEAAAKLGLLGREDAAELQQRQAEEDAEDSLEAGTGPGDTGGVDGDVNEGQVESLSLGQGTPLEAEVLEPDPWELAGRPGPHVVASAELLEQLRAFLEERYAGFGFAFDIIPGPRAAAPLPAAVTGRKRGRGKPAPQRLAAAATAHQGARVEGVAISWRSGQAVYVPLGSSGDTADLTPALAALFASSKLRKATFDLKRQLGLLVSAWGPSVLLGRAPPSGTANGRGLPIALDDLVVDVRIAAWVLNPSDGRLRDDTSATLRPQDDAHTLESLLSSMAGQAAVVDACEGMKLGANGVNSSRQVERCREAAMAHRLARVLLPKLEGGMLSALQGTEMPLVRVLVDMEAAGIAVDEAVLNAERPFLDRRIRQLERQAHQAAGETFNLASSKEVSRILFQKLKLPRPHNSTPLATGGCSTKECVLRELVPLVQGNDSLPHIMLAYRKLTTLRRYMDGFQAAVRQAEPQEFEGGLVLRRIRGRYNQTGSDTGRLAMGEPNLQTVHNPVTYWAVAEGGNGKGEDSVRSSPAGNHHSALLQPLSAEAGGGGRPCQPVAAAYGGGGPPEVGVLLSPGGQHAQRTFSMRSAFVAPPGKLLLSADYRQIELRLMAHFSRDASLLKLFAEEGGDPFRVLAAQWLGVHEGQVNKEQRGQAKQLTYAIIYGMGKGALADKLECSEGEAGRKKDSFLQALPHLAAWRERVLQNCRDTGFVETLAGRRRWLHNIRSTNFQKRSKAERQAINTVCQASAADLCKAAMICVYRRAGAELAPGSCRLLVQIHDELLFEVDRGHLQQAGRLVRKCMEGVAAGLTVTLPVTLSAGPSWGQLEPLDA
ncbi:hypothetical protein N2152v2_004351 [Parachlorella kessleri]